MALLEDMFEGGSVGTGIVAAIGAAVLVPVLTPVLRSVAKTVIKAGIVVYDRGQVMFQDVTEGGSNLIDEAREELEQERSAAEAAEPRRPRRKKEPAPATSEPAMSPTG